MKSLNTLHCIILLVLHKEYFQEKQGIGQSYYISWEAKFREILPSVKTIKSRGFECL